MFKKEVEGDDSIKLDLSFKNIMKVYKNIEDNQEGKAKIDLSLLKANTIEEYIEIFKWLNVQRWLDAEEKIYTPEEKAKFNALEKSFDHLKDFDAYYVDFIRLYNIDLIKDDIDIFRFNWLLTGCMMVEDSVIGKRLGYRTYSPYKGEDAKSKQIQRKLKYKYALREPEDNSLALNSLFKGETL